MQKLKTSEIAVVRAAILKEQGGVCPLCVTPIEKANLDHCHTKGHVRGVLCANCNRHEGRVKHNVTRAKRKLTHAEWLQNLIAYWDKHAEDRTGYMHPKHKTPEEKKAAAAAKRKQKNATH